MMCKLSSVPGSELTIYCFTTGHLKLGGTSGSMISVLNTTYSSFLWEQCLLLVDCVFQQLQVGRWVSGSSWTNSAWNNWWVDRPLYEGGWKTRLSLPDKETLPHSSSFFFSFFLFEGRWLVYFPHFLYYASFKSGSSFSPKPQNHLNYFFLVSSINLNQMLRNWI